MLVSCPQPHAGRSAWQTTHSFSKDVQHPSLSLEPWTLGGLPQQHSSSARTPPPGPAPVLTTLGHTAASICPLRTPAGRLVLGKHPMTPSYSPRPHLCFYPLQGTSGHQSPPASLDGTPYLFSPLNLEASTTGGGPCSQTGWPTGCNGLPCMAPPVSRSGVNSGTLSSADPSRPTPSVT